MSQLGYAIVKEELENRLFEVVPPDSNIGLVQFSNWQQVEIPLNSGLNNSAILDRISQMTQIGGFTYTEDALEFVYKQIFNASIAERQYLVLIVNEVVRIFFQLICRITLDNPSNFFCDVFVFVRQMCICFH